MDNKYKVIAEDYIGTTAKRNLQRRHIMTVEGYKRATSNETARWFKARRTFGPQLGLGWIECVRWVATDPMGIKHISLYKVIKAETPVEEFDVDCKSA